jgi:uncharacterized repeat protein (TIGR02543 family)
MPLTQLVMGSQPVALYALFRKNLDVSFNDQDNSGEAVREIRALMVNSQESAIINPPKQNTPDGWTSMGWTIGTEPNAKALEELSISDNATFYGLYEKALTLTYDANGGSGAPEPETGLLQANSHDFEELSFPKVVLKELPLHLGKEFLGWAEDSNAKTAGYQHGDELMLTESLTLYAVWRHIPVERITDAPTKAISGIDLELHGDVEPSNASNQAIVWTLLDDGGTGATINGSIFTAAIPGDASVLATIADGLGDGEDYTQIIAIKVSQADALAPEILIQPLGGSYLLGTTPSALSVVAAVSDEGELSCQWHKSDSQSNTGGIPLEGETNSSFTPPADMVGTFYYYAVITNNNRSAPGEKVSSIASEAAMIVVYAPEDAQAPIFTMHPESAIYNVGETAAALRASASVTDGGSLSWQWFASASPETEGAREIANATSDTYTPPTDAAGTTCYFVVVTNTNPEATGLTAMPSISEVAKVEARALVDAQTPIIITHPSSAEIYAGSLIELSVEAIVSDGGTLSYQWHMNGIDSTIGGRAVENGASSLFTPPASTPGTLWYYAVVTNTNEEATGSATATATSNTAKVAAMEMPEPEPDPNPVGPDYPTKTFAIKFYNGNLLISSKTVEEGDLLGQAPIPEKAGYAFAGWCTGKSGDGKRYTQSSVVQEDLALYALWAKVVESGYPEPIYIADSPASQSAFITSVESSRMILEALKSGSTPLLALAEVQRGVYAAMDSLQASSQAKRDLVIEKDGYSIWLSPQLIDELSVKSGSQLLAQLSDNPSSVSSSLRDLFDGYSSANEALVKTVKAVELSVGGVSIKKTVNPIKVTVDVSKISSSAKDSLTGIWLDDALGSHKVLGGKLSEDKSAFTFYTCSTGNLSLIDYPDAVRLTLAIGQRDYRFNGAMITNDVAPFISEDGRMMLPVRAIAEALGASVSWVDATKTATVSKGGNTASITLGKPLPDGLGTAVIVDSRFFVPIRYMAETLGANVVWNEEDRTVDIYS